MNPERHSGVAAARHWPQRHTVPVRINARFGQQLAQGGIGPGGCANAQTLDRSNVAGLNSQISAQHQQPECVLRQRSQQFRPLPPGESR